MRVLLRCRRPEESRSGAAADEARVEAAARTRYHGRVAPPFGAPAGRPRTRARAWPLLARRDGDGSADDPRSRLMTPAGKPQEVPMPYVAVAVGGAFGAVARFAITAGSRSDGGLFPWGTLVINLSGRSCSACWRRWRSIGPSSRRDPSDRDDRVPGRLHDVSTWMLDCSAADAGRRWTLAAANLVGSALLVLVAVGPGPLGRRCRDPTRSRDDDADLSGDAIASTAARPTTRSSSAPALGSPARPSLTGSGIGSKQHLHTDRLLTLSVDLPVVLEVVDTEERTVRSPGDRSARSGTD